MRINFKSNNTGFGVPSPATDADVEKIEIILEKCYSIQPELSEYSIYLNYNGLDFDTCIDIDGKVYDILASVECEVIS